MKVLVLYPYLPHPAVAHGSGRLVAPLLRNWREGGAEITLVCGYRPHEARFLGDAAAGVAKLHAAPSPQRADRGTLGRLAESCRTAWREATTGRPRYVVKLDRGDVRRAIRAARAETRFDVAQVELAGFASYVDELRGLPSFLVDHEAGAASGAALATDPRAMRFVREVYPRFTQVGALSEEDAADLRAVTGGDVFVRRPGATAPAESPYAEARVGRLLFFGTAEHAPNLDGLAWLASDLWPCIRASLPTATCVVATGGLPDALRAALDAAGIERLGFVDDIVAEIRRAAVVVAPLRRGRGVRIKNVEALAAGRPLVTTSLGARGLLLTPGVDAEIADDAAAFVEKTVALLRDPARGATLAAAGRAHVLGRFSHEAAAESDLARWRSI